MKIQIKDGRLIVSLKVQEPKPSSSGKTLIIASSRGVQTTSLKIDGQPVRVVANAFIDADDQDE